MKNKIVEYLKIIRKNIVEYIITNRLFLSYVFFALVSTISVRAFTVGKTFSFNPFITDLGLILMIGGLGYLIKPRNQFKYFFSWTCFYNAICLISSVYYRFFTNFASINELASFGQTETVAGSIYDKLKIIDAMYLVIPLIFYLIHKKLSSTSYYHFIDKIEKGKKMVVTTLLVGALCVTYSFGVASNNDYSRLAKQWNRLYIVQRFGVILYQFNDVAQFLTLQISNSFGADEAKIEFTEYFDSIEKPQKNKYSGILKGKNIIFVHMESIQDFLMDLEFNGEEVTPNLNKLASEGMFFTNFYPQVSTGTSSDTEFTLLTGLMPASSGIVFVSYYDRNYFSLPKFFNDQNYYSFSMHGNLSSMWNRNKTHPSLGYKGMYYSESFEYGEDDVINLGINDRLFFAQAVKHLENIEETFPNYMGTIITLSNHTPFKLASEYSDLDLTSHYTVTDKNGEEVEKSVDYLSKTAVGEYIKSANYADKALGDFLKYIKESDYFNNTVFVFYGDHDAKLSRSELNYLYNLNPETGDVYDVEDENYTEYNYYFHELNKKTPLIIWTKNKKLSSIFKGEVTYTTGMYNVSQTILNMFGLYNKYAVGEDVFSVKENNIVVYPNGNVLTNKIYYNNSMEEYMDLKTKKIYSKSDFSEDSKEYKYITELSETAEKRIDISNHIIVYNLLQNLNMNGE